MWTWYLFFALIKKIPDVKYGVRFNNWLDVYFPGGNNKFYKEFDNESSWLRDVDDLGFYIIFPYYLTRIGIFFY